MQGEKPKLVGGFFWWFLLGIFIFLDLLDLLFTALAALIGATGLGLPIAAIIVVVDNLIDMFATFTTATYYKFTGVPLGFRNIALLSIGFLCEWIPVLDVLPWLSITFVATRILTNITRKGAAKSGLLGKAVGLTPVGRAGKLVSLVAR